jgi:flagellar basal body-associated protein FliL
MWAVLLIPLCAALAIVYKTIKCGAVRRIPREALTLFITIIVCMVMAAAALAGIVRLME